jgi:hypothetical protein
MWHRESSTVTKLRQAAVKADKLRLKFLLAIGKKHKVTMEIRYRGLGSNYLN